MRIETQTGKSIEIEGFVSFYSEFLHELEKSDIKMHQKFVGNDDSNLDLNELKVLEAVISSILEKLISEKSGQKTLGIIKSEHIILGRKIELGTLDELDGKLRRYSNLHNLISESLDLGNIIYINKAR